MVFVNELLPYTSRTSQVPVRQPVSQSVTAVNRDVDEERVAKCDTGIFMLLLEQALTSPTDFYHCTCPAVRTEAEKHVYSYYESDNAPFIRNKRKNSHLYHDHSIHLTNGSVIYALFLLIGDRQKATIVSFCILHRY